MTPQELIDWVKIIGSIAAIATATFGCGTALVALLTAIVQLVGG